MPDLPKVDSPLEDADTFGDAFSEFTMPEKAATPAPEPSSAPAPAPEPKAPPPDEVSDEDLIARLAALVNKAPAPKPAPQEPAAPVDELPGYTPEEAEFLATYESEWSEVSKAEAIKRRVEQAAMVRYVFNEVASVFRPMEQNLQRLLQQAQLSELRTTVPEYDTVREGVVAWAEKQPPYLRAAYQHVIQHGTVEEVADLVARYTKETGTPHAPEPQQKAATELPTSAKQAAATLAPVSSKRSAVAAAEPDKGDFEGAFARFASAS
jgi:hypothetical protein